MKYVDSKIKPWCIQCRVQCKAFGLFGPFRVQRWRCRRCLITFSSGSYLKIATPLREIRKPEVFMKAQDLFLAGHSIRRVAGMLNIHNSTSRHYQNVVSLTRPLLCACGKDIKHQGFCSFRISLSPSRQSYLARCSAQSAATRLARIESRAPLLTTWPFVRSFDGDDYALMKIVNELVPRTIPELVRQDVCQDILVDVVSGKLSTVDIAGRVSGYTKRAFKFVPSKFGPMSLDDAIYSEGRETYADRLIG